MWVVIEEFVDNNYIFVNDNQREKFIEDFTELFNTIAAGYDLHDETDILYTPELKQALLDTYLQSPTQKGRRKNQNKAEYPDLKEKGIFKQNGLYIKERYDFPAREIEYPEYVDEVIEPTP